MIEPLATTLTFAALAAAVWALALIALNRPVDLCRPDSRALLGLLTLIELGLLVQAAAGIVNLFTAEREFEHLTFGAYLIGLPFVLPVATAWAMAERTRWGPGVLVIGAVAVPVMTLRLSQVWAGAA
ncbi:hypothetical protein [Amycolatopsis vastitatis]|uniref:Integral membrane protein n=1 Tax=Amycolatopsis vastitatis TaxID=1905142 RepID=A0A229TFN0_9PSEU|nr:hypothetical protein [Amycolatopsis vastitatis]OXM69549.1 hypothetical protein CF165_08515 [Amycolatopsis vastitatis]